MSVTLRQARSTDAGRTGEILHRFQIDTPWMPELHTGAETIAFCGNLIDRGWVTVIETGGQIQGFLAREGKEVHCLYLADDATGQGLGKVLLDAAKAGRSELGLWTFQANTRAQKFYLREGFNEIRRTDGAGNDESLPDIYYVWLKETEIR